MEVIVTKFILMKTMRNKESENIKIFLRTRES